MNRHVPPHDFDAREAEAFTPPPPPDFTKARRHSARVRWIKRLVPVTIIVAVIGIGAVSILTRLKLSIDLPFDIGHLTLSGSRLTMELPKLSGFTDDNRGYRITARTAVQDLTRPDVIELADVEARLELADKGWASVNAKTGSFDTKKQFITLGDGVDLAMNGGYGGKLEDAEVDIKGGTIATAHPVVFTYLDGKLVADRLDVTDRGARALFQGHVQLDFRMSNLPGQKPDGANAAGNNAAGANPAAPTHAADATPVSAIHAAPAAPATTGTITVPPAPSPAAPALAPAPLPPRRPVPAQ
jgi:lipopolysaccharide export system protein LptC